MNREMEAKLKIERRTERDIPLVHQLELKVFSNDSWPIEWFQEGVNDPDGYYYIAYFDNEIVGYCGMYHVKNKIPNYCKIASLAVDESFRRKGIGKTLINKMLETAKNLGLNSAKLEVSTKNAAIELYHDLGFKVMEFKENYYQESGDDAYIMWRYE